MKTPYQSVDQDALFSYELMELLSFSKDELQINERYDKYTDIYNYFKPQGIKQARYYINKICLGKPIDRLEHVWGWTELRKELDGIMSGSSSVNPSMRGEQESRLKEEISFYER